MTTSERLKRVLHEAEMKAGGLYEESQRERTLLIKSLRALSNGTNRRPECPVAVFLEVEPVQEHDFSQLG
jgi:hypothetical protein